jgi:hypothetical protein
MTARTIERKVPAPTTDDAAKGAYMQLEDATRDVQQGASLLAKYFELEATQHKENDIDMFAAMALEDVAHDIIKNVQTITDAADKLRVAALSGAR